MPPEMVYAFLWGQSSQFGVRIAGPYGTLERARDVAYERRVNGYWTGRVRKMHRFDFDDASRKVAQGVLPW